MSEKPIDLLTMGRAAVDLYADQIGATLQEASSFSKYVGGCPANIAIGASRLGLKTAILSRVGDEEMGRYVAKTLEREKVDISLLQTDPMRLTGLVLLGIQPPGRFPLLFYRENCADMQIDTSSFTAETFAAYKAVVVTGTHCSRDETFEATLQVARLAKEAECRLILDIDYRPVLWGAAGHGQGEERFIPLKRAAKRLQQIIAIADLIVGTEEELLVATHENSVNAAIRFLQKATAATIVQKRGEQGCIVYPKDDNPIEAAPFSVPLLNILGAGDAFMSGFLRGYLEGRSLNECARLGNACGALVVSRHGCSLEMPYWEELTHFLLYPDQLTKTMQLHRCLQRRSRYQELFLLAFDHRDLFKNHLREDVIRFKEIIFSALPSKEGVGIIIDDEFGSGILQKATQMPIARCIEQGGDDLCFMGGREAAEILHTWPSHNIVKVLVNNVGTALLNLYRATILQGHPLLIELISGDIAAKVRACYEMSIYPAWWKLPPSSDIKCISQLIEKYDPHCNGILLLGQNASLEELEEQITQAKGGFVKGFAVGRTIWQQAADDWFSAKISDEEARETITDRFNKLLHAWTSYAYAQAS